MKVRVVVGPDGSINLFTDNGTFADGKAKLEALLAELKADGLTLKDVGEVETHRHNHGEEHVDGHVHGHAH